MDPFTVAYALTLALVLTCMVAMLLGMIGATVWCALSPRPPIRDLGLTEAEWAERMRALDEFFSESRNRDA
jgi:hypothetical protein